MEEKSSTSGEEIGVTHSTLEKILRDEIQNVIAQIVALEKPVPSPSFFFRASRAAAIQQFHATKREDFLSILQKNNEVALKDVCNTLYIFMREISSANIACYNYYQEQLYIHAQHLYAYLHNGLALPLGPWLDDSKSLAAYCKAQSTNDTVDHLAQAGYAPAMYQVALLHYQALENFRPARYVPGPDGYSVRGANEVGKNNQHRRQKLKEIRDDWIRRTAAKEYSPAQLMLALHVEQDSTQGYALLNHLVEQNYAPAQYHLAVCYEEGRLKLTPDKEKALQLYMLASQSGYAPAQDKLKGYTALQKTLSALPFFPSVLQPIVAAYVGYQAADSEKKFSCMLS